jgi:hypothetical protein
MCRLRPHQHVITFFGVCPNPLSIVTAFAPGVRLFVIFITPRDRKFISVLFCYC